MFDSAGPQVAGTQEPRAVPPEESVLWEYLAGFVDGLNASAMNLADRLPLIGRFVDGEEAHQRLLELGVSEEAIAASGLLFDGSLTLLLSAGGGVVVQSAGKVYNLAGNAETVLQVAEALAEGDAGAIARVATEELLKRAAQKRASSKLGTVDPDNASKLSSPKRAGDAAGATSSIPKTLGEVNLKGTLQGFGKNLADEGKFFGWKPGYTSKAASDFSKEMLLQNGWTKERLSAIAEAYEHIARITPNNPSAAGRATQLRGIIDTFFD